MVQYPAPNVPGVLWAAPFCLHDSSSSAAMQMKLIFEQLTKRGVRCHAISALTFDAPCGTTIFPDFDKQLEQENVEWFNVAENGVSYQYLKTSSRSVGSMTRDEEAKLFVAFLNALAEFKPAVLFIYGGGVLEMSIVAEAKRRSIATVMYIPNGNYADYSFPCVDMLVTESTISARNYYNNSRVNIMPIGTFIDVNRILAPKDDSAKYITLINPHPSKGVSLFLNITQWAQKNHPDWRFLVIESRGSLGGAFAAYKQEPEKFSNVDVAQHTADIRKIYAITKLLIVPSLWYEGFGRVAAEAVINGIPVLSSTSGGLPDAINGGGMSVPAPQECHKNLAYYPQDEEMQPWYDALESMLDPEEYPKWQEKAQEASKQHDIEKNTDVLMDYLKPLLERRANFHPQYFLR